MEHREEDKAETKYWKEVEKYTEMCNFDIVKQDSSDLISLFYHYNHPDIYELQIITRSGYTRIQIYHSSNHTTIINLSDIDYTNALIRAIGKFIEYMAQEFKPTF